MSAWIGRCCSVVIVLCGLTGGYEISAAHGPVVAASGTVRDASGSAVAGANVVLKQDSMVGLPITGPLGPQYRFAAARVGQVFGTGGPRAFQVAERVRF